MTALPSLLSSSMRPRPKIVGTIRRAQPLLDTQSAKVRQTDNWDELRVEIEQEMEAIFASSGEVLVLRPDRESGAIVTLSSRTRSLRLTYLPDRNSVRWDLDAEYSFERIPEQTAALARFLIQRLR
jgi:DNA mismatch repair protein MutH